MLRTSPPPIPNSAPPLIPPTLRLDHEHPWPGLISFTEADHAFFFGREREVAELARVIRQKTVTVFFGKSGLGKSSILRAGVSPLLRESEFVPVYIRLNHDEAAPPLEDQVEIAIEEVLATERIEAAKPVRTETLWEYFHKKENDWWDADNRSVKPVLIFDQFEELLTLGQTTPERSARTTAFLTDLEDLVENRPPAALVERFEAERGLARNYDLERLDYRVVLTLREDFLADLEGLRERLRATMFNRVRLLPMNGEQAMDVVLKPAGHLVDEDVAVRIVDFVSSSERSRLQADVTRAQLAKRSIEPALLSVVLQELNNRRIQAGQEKITAELVGKTNPTEIFHDFYLRGLEGMDGEVREFIEDSLLTSSGARNRIAEEDASTRRGISTEVVTKLIDRRIVQRETTGNIKWLELTHDTLADVVRTDRAEHQQQRQLELVKAQEKEARAKLRRVQKLAAAFALLFVGALLLTLYAFVETRQARRAQSLTTQTTDALATGILRKIEQNPRIRVREKLFLTQRFIDSVQRLRNAPGASHDLATRQADLLATASLMLFDAGHIDEATDYAQNAQKLLTTEDAPLVVARSRLACVLAQRFGWKIGEDDALRALDGIETQLRKATISEPEDLLLAQILNARLAWARSDALRCQNRYDAADQVAVAAISEIEKDLTSPNVESTKDDLSLRNLTRELLKLYILRYRIARMGGMPLRFEEIHDHLQKALQTAKSRFSNGEASLWTYFEAKDLQLAADIQQRAGSYDQGLGLIGSAISKLNQLLMEDPENMLWRYELGSALCLRSEIATAAGASAQASTGNEDQGKRDREAALKLAKADLEAARKLAITLRRDQSSQYLPFYLFSLIDLTDDSDEAAAIVLTRLNLETQRYGSSEDFRLIDVLANQAGIKAALRKELYAEAVKHANTALTEIDKMQFTDKEMPQRAVWRVRVIQALLDIGADKLGRERWLAYYKTALGDAKNSSDLTELSYIIGLRADRYLQDAEYSQANTAFKEAIDATMSGIDKEEDQRIDLQNYLYYQSKIILSDVALKHWSDIQAVSRNARTYVSRIAKDQSKFASLIPYVNSMVSEIEAARKSLAEEQINPSEETRNVAEALAAESKALDAQAENLQRAQESKSDAAFPSTPRIDLQSFAVKDFRAGTKDNYLLVKQRLGWEDAPIFPGAWRTVTGKEFDDAAALVASKKGVTEKQIQRIRICPLNFYEQGQIIEAEYLDLKGDLYTAPILAAKGQVYQLNGTSPPIHQANASVPLHLKNAEDVAAYLRFFCSYVRGEKGAFQIVENVTDLPWAPGAPPELKHNVGRLLRPLVVWPDPGANGDWRAIGSVQYSDAIFHAALKIQKGGMLEMSDDEPVASDMPFNLPVYNNGDRSAGKLEALDLSMVSPPSGDDEVEGLLSVAESEDSRAPRYLELADEAAALQLGIASTFGGDEKSALVLSKVLTRVAWCEILAKKFDTALSWTDKAPKTNSDYLPLQKERAHALLFLGRTAEAEAIYRKYVGDKIAPDSQKSWAEDVSADFDALERAGNSHPDFNHIREMLKTTSAG